VPPGVVLPLVPELLVPVPVLLLELELEFEFVLQELLSRLFMVPELGLVLS
jgi:hypothetical protein